MGVSHQTAPVEGKMRLKPRLLSLPRARNILRPRASIPIKTGAVVLPVLAAGGAISFECARPALGVALGLARFGLDGVVMMSEPPRTTGN